MRRLRHDLPPLEANKFMAAIALGRERAQEAMDEELAEMPVGQPTTEPEKYQTRLWGDNEASKMMAAIDTFDGDHDLALSCQFRSHFLMQLITKRKFRRYRRRSPGGGFEVNEIFVRAVCEMPFTQSMSRRRRAAKRALAQEIRRQERLERREVTE
jgi:hypothetical protein